MRGKQIRFKHAEGVDATAAALRSLSSTTPLFPFTVPETLDRKHFQQEGMRIHTSSVKGPPQVCAQASCSAASADCHGNGRNCMVRV